MYILTTINRIARREQEMAADLRGVRTETYGRASFRSFPTGRPEPGFFFSRAHDRRFIRITTVRAYSVRGKAFDETVVLRAYAYYSYYYSVKKKKKMFFFFFSHTEIPRKRVVENIGVKREW